MTTDQPTKWKKIIIIALIIFTLIVVLITAIVGVGGLFSFFKWLIGLILVLAILFGLFYVFYMLFIEKSYKDIPANYKKKLLMTARLMRNKLTGDLYLSGDTKHNRIKLGNYYYMRIELPRQNIKEIPNPDKDALNKTIIKESTTSVPVDCFVMLRKGVVDKLFNKPLFVLVKPEDHDYSSIFNDVTIKGFNLVPLDSQFFTINSRNLDVDIIKGMATNYIREVVYEIFRDLDRLVKQAMNLDQQFAKDRKKSLEFEIPQVDRFTGGHDDSRR